MGTFSLNVFYHAKPGMRDAFIKELKESGAQAQVQAEDGCIRYDYYASAEDENTVLLVEEWRDTDAQAVHMGQPHIRTIMEIKDKYILSTELRKFTDLSDIYKERRSIRSFSPAQVPKQLLEKVVDAGLWAASGVNEQTTVIFTVTDPALRDRIMKANAAVMGSDGDPFYGAPDIIVVADRKDSHTPVYNGSLALGNMMLKAYELGLGTCWIHRAKQEFEGELGQELLQLAGLSGEYIGVGHLAIGYPAGEAADRPRKEGRAFFF